MSAPVSRKKKWMIRIALGVGALSALVVVVFNSLPSSGSESTATPPRAGDTKSASRRGKAPALQLATSGAHTPLQNTGVASLGALTATLEAEGDSAIVGHKIRGLFLTDPDASKRVLAILNKGVTHKTATTLVFELGKAGTPEAQLVLANIYADDDRSTRLRRQALIAAGGLTEPTADTRASLWEMFRAASASAPSQVGPAALLGLGRIGATLRGKGDSAYQEERTRLIAVLGESNDERGIQLALKAIGNTHDSSLVPNAIPYMTNVSARIRAVAAETVGRLGGPEASRLLLERLAAEQVGWVRRNVVVGIYKLERPSEETLAALSSLVVNERDEAVRNEMLRVLAKNNAS